MTAVVLRGDAAHLPLPDGSVDLIVTSPPYWSLRDYRDGGESLKGQIGSEETWQEYLANLLACTREWVRVLKPSGSIFVNLGDKYANDAKWGGATSGKHVEGLHGKTGIGRAKVRTGIPAKSLIGLPWRYALGCVDDLGLILRAETIWDKPNGLPESVTDRVRRSHEQVFHFTRQPRYYSAVDEIREKYAPGTAGRYKSGYNPDREAYAAGGPTKNGALRHDGGGPKDPNPLGKLPGSVWVIPSAPLFVPLELGIDHFAAYPPDLVRRIVLGWSPSGICDGCGEGRRPVMARERATNDRGRTTLAAEGRTRRLGATSGLRTNATAGDYPAGVITGLTCACPDLAAPTRSAAVLDPFGGTGTTALVADVLGRTGISVDRSAAYCRLARWRTRDPGERARAMQVPKPPPVPEGQASLFDLEAS